MSDENKSVDITVPVPMAAISSALERGVSVAIARDREITEKIRATIRAELESPEFRQLIRTLIKDLVETGGREIADRYVKRHQDRLFGNYADEVSTSDRSGE
jgi:hypothetical protein